MGINVAVCVYWSYSDLFSQRCILVQLLQFTVFFLFCVNNKHNVIYFFGLL